MTLEERNRYFERDYFTILGVSRNASSEEIKKAYHTLAFKCHPDLNNNSNESTQQMALLNEAYAVLSDAAKRIIVSPPDVPSASEPKYKPGTKVKINNRSSSPYRDKNGVVDKSTKDTFRYWYTVRFESKDFSTISRFAEEELTEIS